MSRAAAKRAAATRAMNKAQAEKAFKADVMPTLIQQERGRPDKPMRREAWNDVVDAWIRAGYLPERAYTWTPPAWLETWGYSGAQRAQRAQSRRNAGNPELRIEHQGKSPLHYDRTATVQRLGLVDPEANEPNPRDYGMTYFAETQRRVFYGTTGRKLKTPRFEKIPGAAPGTVAFVDYHKLGSNRIYVDYAKTRPDYSGRGYIRTLLEGMLQSFPEVTSWHFGKIMAPAIGKIHDDWKARGIPVAGHKDF